MKCIRLELAGQKFGRLTVIKFSHVNKNGNACWLCKCDCGNEKIVASGSLKKGFTKSCGCLLKERYKLIKLPKGVASRNILYRAYIKNAKSRGLRFDISKKRFREIISKNCYYCGSPPLNTLFTPNHSGSYVYSGIDRVDNTKGYLEDNIVSCCIKCNGAKGKMPAEEFIQWLDQLVSYRNNI